MREQESSRNLQSVNEDDLFLAVGSQLAEAEKFMKPPSVNELIMKGKVWFDLHVERFQSAVCQEKVRKLLEGDEAVLITAIADLIAGIVTGVSPVTVSLLICKKGVRSLCAEDQPHLRHS